MELAGRVRPPRPSRRAVRPDRQADDVRARRRTAASRGSSSASSRGTSSRPRSTTCSASRLAAVKVVSIVGNRPQFIKAAPVARGARRPSATTSSCTPASTTTPTSRRSSSRSSGCAPADRRIESGSGTHAEQTARMLVGLEPVLEDEAPDAVLVYGDTNSTLAGALVAAKLARADRPRRGGPALVRPAHAGGAEPDGRRRPRRPALLPVRHRRHEPRRRGHHRRRPHGRRRDGRRRAHVRPASRPGARTR